VRGPFWIRAAFAFLVIGSVTANADVPEGLDMSAGTGGALGSVAKTREDGTAQTYPIGGVPFAAILNRDLAEHWAGGLEAQMMLDIVNQQMIRQGFAGSISYHLLGGPRRLVWPGSAVNITSMSHYNLSFKTRGGIFNYAAAARNDPGHGLSGSVWEFSAGVEYRQDLSERNAAGTSLMTTVLSLPASIDRLSTSMTELLLFWRFYL
jgi:hypothetical protein